MISTMDDNSTRESNYLLSDVIYQLSEKKVKLNRNDVFPICVVEIDWMTDEANSMDSLINLHALPVILYRQYRL
jgi:hypothetical protein